MNEHQQPEGFDLAASEALLDGVGSAAPAELAAVLDALRAPARPAELADAAQLVPQLAATARQSSVPGALARGTRRMFVLGAAGAVLAGGAAAAATGALDPILPGPERPVVVDVVETEAEHDDPAENPAETGVPTSAAAVPEEPVELPEDGPDWLTEELAEICSDPEANHGEYVSSVAQLDDDEWGEETTNRGQIVSQAARDKDCDGVADDHSTEGDDRDDTEDEGRDRDDADPNDDSDHDDAVDRDGENNDADDDGRPGNGKGPKPKKDKSNDDD